MSRSRLASTCSVTWRSWAASLTDDGSVRSPACGSGDRAASPFPRRKKSCSCRNALTYRSGRVAQGARLSLGRQATLDDKDLVAACERAWRSAAAVVGAFDRTRQTWDDELTSEDAQRSRSRALLLVAQAALGMHRSALWIPRRGGSQDHPDALRRRVGAGWRHQSRPPRSSARGSFRCVGCV